MLDVHRGEALLVEGFAAILRGACQREPQAVVGDPADLFVGLPGDGPAIDLGGLGPPPCGSRW